MINLRDPLAVLATGLPLAQIEALLALQFRQRQCSQALRIWCQKYRGGRTQKRPDAGGENLPRQPLRRSRTERDLDASNEFDARRG